MKYQRTSNRRFPVVWLTGNTGAGKSTLAFGVQESLNEGHQDASSFLARRIVVLDGDEMRATVSTEEGISPEDRRRHNLRVARLANLLADHGFLVLVSVIAPFESVRRELQEICDPLWVYVERSGLSAADRPYEPPEHPSLTIDNDIMGIEDGRMMLQEFLMKLTEKGFLLEKSFNRCRENPYTSLLCHSVESIFLTSLEPQEISSSSPRTMILALIDRKNKLIMDWSAKAGCTICVKMFFQHMGILEKALEYHPWVHKYRDDVFYRTNVVTEDDLHDPSYFKFKIVRNPYARVVSGYCAIMHHVYTEKYEPDQREKQGILEAIQSDTTDISFSQFVDYVSKQNVTQCNIHYAQQKKEYETDDTFDAICKLENINEEVERINRMAGTQFIIADETGHHTIRNPAIAVNVSDRPWSAIKDNIPLYSYFYNPDIERKVYSIYREDVERYHYSFEDLLKSDSLSQRETILEARCSP